MTTNKTPEEGVKETVARVFHREPAQINRNTRFVEDLYAKSINIVELLAMLEYQYGIEIPRAQARQAKNVGQAIDLVTSLLKK